MADRTEAHNKGEPIEIASDVAEAPSELPPNEERSISLGRRIRHPRTLISFLVAFALIAFVFQNLDVNVGSLWASIRAANPLLLFLAFLAYYGSFPLRAIRWRVFLANAQIDEKHGFRIPGVRGLSEIYILGWFA
ncbi:MAG: lysylphosphatidylglycerol synthase domain-containing protein, partial [Chloroflexota bacterium]